MEEKSNVSRFTVSLSTEGNNALNAIMTLTNRNPNREKSNVIDEAIQFYFSYLSGQLNMDYVCGIYGRQVEALVQRATDRISSQLFKQAVETNMLTRIVAFGYELCCCQCNAAVTGSNKNQTAGVPAEVHRR